MTTTRRRTIHVAHSPDADDAFMFWALAAGRIDTGDRRYVHELGDIESLNRRGLAGGREGEAGARRPPPHPPHPSAPAAPGAGHRRRPGTPARAPARRP